MHRLSDSAAAVGRWVGLSGTVAIMVRTQAKPEWTKERVCVCVRVGDDVFAAWLRRIASHRSHASSQPSGGRHNVELIDRALDTAIMLCNALVITLQLKFHGYCINVSLDFPHAHSRLTHSQRVERWLRVFTAGNTKEIIPACAMFICYPAA